MYNKRGTGKCSVLFTVSFEGVENDKKLFSFNDEVQSIKSDVMVFPFDLSQIQHCV